MWRSSKWDRCWQILCVVINNTATWSYHLHGYTDLLDGKHKSGLLRGGASIFGDWWSGYFFVGDLVICTWKNWWFGDLKKLWWWWFSYYYVGDLVISTSKNWWFGDFQKLWWWWFTYFLVIRICLNLEQKGLKIVILVLKILGDLIVFSWWLVI